MSPYGCQPAAAAANESPPMPSAPRLRRVAEEGPNALVQLRKPVINSNHRRAVLVNRSPFFRVGGAPTADRPIRPRPVRARSAVSRASRTCADCQRTQRVDSATLEPNKRCGSVSRPRIRNRISQFRVIGEHGSIAVIERLISVSISSLRYPSIAGAEARSG